MWVVRYGRTDLKGVMMSVKKKEYFYYVVNLVEMSISLSKTQPERFSRGPNSLSQSTIIFDMDEFSMRHITYKPGKQFLRETSKSSRVTATKITRQQPVKAVVRTLS